MLSPDAWAVLILAGGGFLLQAGLQMGYLRGKFSGLEKTVAALDITVKDLADNHVKTLSKKVENLPCVTHGLRLQSLEEEIKE